MANQQIDSIREWHLQAQSQLEFSNHSSLDQLNINVRWLKEWRVHKIHDRTYMFPYTAIWLVTQGKATITLNRMPYEIQAGDILCIPPQTLKTWEGVSTPLNYVSLACEAKIGALDFVRLYGIPYVISSVETTAFEGLIDGWRELAELYSTFLGMFEPQEVRLISEGSDLRDALFMLNTDQSMQHLRIRTRGMDWMLRLLDALRHVLPDHPVAYDNRVFEVCEYVAARSGDPLTLDDLASRASLSKEQLRALFQSTLGLSPMKYVRQVRMQRAKELLTMTSYSVKEIAQLVGFDNQHHFSRAFHQYHHMPPLAYRLSHKR